MARANGRGIRPDSAEPPWPKQMPPSWRKSYEEMCDGLLESDDPDVVEWAQEQIDNNLGERSFQRIWDKVEAKRSGKKDNSREDRARKEIAKFKKEGCNYEETKARLLDCDDQGVVDWVNERGLRDDERDLKEAFEKIRGGARGSNKPQIFWAGDTEDAACVAAEEALVGLGTLYERMGVIVSVARGKGRDRDGILFASRC